MFNPDVNCKLLPTSRLTRGTADMLGHHTHTNTQQQWQSTEEELWVEPTALHTYENLNILVLSFCSIWVCGLLC